MNTTWQDVLSKPFGPDEVTFRVGSKRAGKLEVFTYLDARQVAAKLSEVDPAWSVEFSAPSVRHLDYTLPRGKGEYKREVEQVRASVAAKITISPPGDDFHIISREDTGETIGDISDENLVKTAYSDALKRAAVHFGVGAYLYSLKGKIAPVAESAVEYGRLTDGALHSLRHQYAVATNQLHLNESQLLSLRAILSATGKYKDGVEEWLVQQPASSFEQLVAKATENLSGSKLIESAFDAEKVS